MFMRKEKDLELGRDLYLWLIDQDRIREAQKHADPDEFYVD
jgi:hypothetical protein